MAHEEDDDTRWHLDKRVPIALVVLIIAQTAGAIWWASAVNGSIAALERRVDFGDETNRRQYDRINADREAGRQTAEQLARVEGLLQSIDRQVTGLVTHIMQGKGK
jgi:hypothetical protein